MFIERKWKLIALLAALVLIAIGVAGSRRPHEPEVTLHYLGRDASHTAIFVVTNHAGRQFNCAGLSIQGWFPMPSVQRLPPHGSVQFQYDGHFTPGSDVSVFCTPDPGITLKVRAWLRRAGIPVRADARALRVGLTSTTEDVARRWQ